MAFDVAFIGFGEAGRTFAGAPGWTARARAYDVLSDDAATRVVQAGCYATAGITGVTTLDAAVADVPAILSVVTADAALAVAQAASQHLAPGALFFDMNSVAPDTKRSAARVIEAGGGRYVDVAVMAPVDPARLAVPLMLSGPHAQAGAQSLEQFGFSDVRVLPGDVGRASSVKMIRSIMVKGIEALTAELMLAGTAAGVTDVVLASLGPDWPAKAAYNLDRMQVHGTRRAAEMREVAKTLEGLGVDPVMTRGTIARQAEMGGQGAETGLKDAA